MEKVGRILHHGDSGADVLLVKKELFAKGYYPPSVKEIKSDRWGADTDKAVENFRSRYIPQGEINDVLWDAIFEAEPLPEAEIPPNIGLTARGAIDHALQGISARRKAMVLNALMFAWDPEVPAEYPYSFYIRGANLYDGVGSLHVMTKARLDAYFNRSAYSQYFSNGRKEMMIKASEANGYTASGADCSGGVVGLLRNAELVKSGWDCSADGFFKQTGSWSHVQASEMIPGDLVHKSGHIGMHVGAGYTVSWEGGAYGCQLIQVGKDLDQKRRDFDFVSRGYKTLGAWEHYLHGKFY